MRFLLSVLFFTVATGLTAVLAIDEIVRGSDCDGGSCDRPILWYLGAALTTALYTLALTLVLRRQTKPAGEEERGAPRAGGDGSEAMPETGPAPTRPGPKP